MHETQIGVNMELQALSRRQFLKLTGLSAASPYLFALHGCSDVPGLNTRLFMSVEKTRIKLVIPRTEMGQGIDSALAILLAEEMSASLGMIEVVYAQAKPELGYQMTVGSDSIRTWYLPMRRLGSQLKNLALAIAERNYALKASDIKISEGRFSNPQGTFLADYPSLLAESQSTDKPLAKVGPLKPKADFKLIGHATPSLSLEQKVRGQFKYTGDQNDKTLYIASVGYRDGQPRPSEAKLSELKQQFKLTGIAVIEAKACIYQHFVIFCSASHWPLQQTLSTLRASGNRTNIGMASAARATEDYQQVSKAHEIKLTFQTPAIAHGALEPPIARVSFDSEKIYIEAPSQAPQSAVKALSKALGIDNQQIILQTTPAGGAFGRKRYHDFIIETALAAQHFHTLGLGEHYCLFWDRHDDLAREHYRPETRQQLGWQAQAPRALSYQLIEGDPNLSLLNSQPINPAPWLALQINGQQQRHDTAYVSAIWRSVSHGYIAFALCSMLDEIARQQAQDPIDYYLNQLKTSSLKEQAKYLIDATKAPPSQRMQGVVTTVRELANWDAQPNLADNETLGFAAYSCFGSYIACIVKIALDPAQKLHVKEVWLSADCGQVVNTDGAMAQLEGGFLYGLSAVLYQQNASPQAHHTSDFYELNFDTQAVARIKDSPAIHCQFMASDAAPTGLGELAVPVVAPAVCNALRSLTGYRFTKLPLFEGSALNTKQATLVSKS